MAGSQDDWTLVRDLFDELIDLPDDLRESRLTQQDVAPATSVRVRALLAAAAKDGPLDKRLDPSLGPVAGEPALLPPGTTVGDFVIDRAIGRGGMGEVFEAHRDRDGFRQRAALKLLRVDAARNRAAFTRERKLLAQLEHPGIARLIDGGIASDGRPFLAMEFVDGEPIDRWVETHAADLATRLRLFLEICGTLTFAHARLIVHRDLKPSNILVDQGGRARIVDFGIAKLLDDVAPADGADTTQLMMTPEFAAPEQLEGGVISVETDIYALGVVLYALLAGESPWATGSGSVPATIRRVLSGDPLPPSRAIQTTSPIAASAVRGDLDAIVLKAMRREPAARYASAGEMAEDVRRHLAAEPVHARAGTRRYRLGRFVRRYRVGLTASAAVAATMIAGMIGIAVQGHRAAVDRDVALAEAERLDAVVQMMTLMTENGSGQDDMSVKSMLDAAARRILATADGSARSAALVIAMADLYINRQDPKGLYDFLKTALAHGVGGEDATGSAEMKLRLATVTAAMGNDAEAGQLLDAADPVFVGNDDRHRIDRVEAVGVRAQLARRAGDTPRAIVLLRDTLPEAEVAYAGHKRELLTRYNNLLVYLLEVNDLDAFGALIPRVNAVIAGNDLSDSIQGLGIRLAQANWRMRKGDVAAAETAIRQISNRRRVLYPGTGGLANDLSQLARTLIAQGKFAEARAAMEEALPIAEATLGPAATPTLTLQMQMVEADAEDGHVAAAANLFDQIAPKVAALPPIPRAALARAEAVLRLNQHRPAEARAALDRAVAIMAPMGAAGTWFVGGLGDIRKRVDQAASSA